MKKILILEDDQVNLELLNIYLKDDFENTLTGNFEQAKEAVKKIKFDLIISDIYLGNGSPSGMDFLHFLKSDDATKHIPVVAFTAYADSVDINNADFAGYISKPVLRSDFLKMIHDILDRD